MSDVEQMLLAAINKAITAKSGDIKQRKEGARSRKAPAYYLRGKKSATNKGFGGRKEKESPTPEELVIMVTRLVDERVERVFQTRSPTVGEVSVKRGGAVRRAKLYYLRDLSGEAAENCTGP